MISASDLDSKDRGLYASGKEFTLNNGAVVTIPSMPIGSVAAKFLRIQKKLAEPPLLPKKDKGGKVVKKKEIDEETGEEKMVTVMVENKDWIDPTSEQGMDFFLKLLHQILNLTHEVSVQECDGLFSMGHFGPIVTWFYTGQEGPSVGAAGGSADPTEIHSASSAAEALGVPAEILS